MTEGEKHMISWLYNLALRYPPKTLCLRLSHSPMEVVGRGRALRNEGLQEAVNSVE